MTQNKKLIQQMPEMLHQFELLLRSGYNIKQSLDILVNDLSEPMSSEMGQIGQDIDNGQTVIQAFDAFLSRVPHADIDLFVATIRVQFDSRGNLADKFSFLNQVMAKRRLVPTGLDAS